MRRYVFAAQPHHEFRVGSIVHHGGEVFELEESLATDPRLIEVLPESEEPRDEDYPDVVEDEAAEGPEQALEEPGSDAGPDSVTGAPSSSESAESPPGVDRSLTTVIDPEREFEEQLEPDGLHGADDRDDDESGESGMPRPRP